MGSPGKVLTQPVLVLPLLAIAFWFISHQLARHGRPARQVRRWRALGVGTLLFLWWLSTPLATGILGATLMMDQPDSVGPFDAIVVLAGGHVRLRSPSVASADTTVRVIIGVEWWHRFPDSMMIMSGGSPYDIPDGGTPVPELMREIAVEHGVPIDGIVTENVSTNTREHPREVIRLPGIDRSTRIGLVSSRWHLRRATIEFRRHFEHVTPLYLSDTRVVTGWRMWLPNADALLTSTRMVHEWIGITWYWLLSVGSS